VGFLGGWSWELGAAGWWIQCAACIGTNRHRSTKIQASRQQRGAHAPAQAARLVLLLADALVGDGPIAGHALAPLLSRLAGSVVLTHH